MCISSLDMHNTLQLFSLFLINEVLLETVWKQQNCIIIFIFIQSHLMSYSYKCYIYIIVHIKILFLIHVEYGISDFNCDKFITL